MKDKVPDYTTISYYRINRLGDAAFEEYFKAIVEQCNEQGLVKQRRYLIDTTNIDSNTNYPSTKKLVCQSYYRVMKFAVKDCSNCPLLSKCLTEDELNRGKKRRTVIIPARYDAVINAMKRNQTEKFKEAINKRYIVERRFATLVRNHGLRVSRYLRMKGASIHINMANIACKL